MLRMFGGEMVKVTNRFNPERGHSMDNTHEFVQKVHDTQKKAEQNQKRQGEGNPGEKLQNKQHSTNK